MEPDEEQNIELDLLVQNQTNESHMRMHLILPFVSLETLDCLNNFQPQE
jgi:hypothetical protein